MSEETVVTTEEAAGAVEATTEADTIEPSAESTTAKTQASEKAFVDTFLENLTDEEVKNHKLWDNLKGKDADELGRYVKELKSFAGKKGDIPKEDASEEEWNEFFGKLGRPESIEGYEFGLNDEFKSLVGDEQAPFYEKVVDVIKSQAFAMAATPEKAEEAVGALLDLVAEQNKEVQAIMEKRAEENDATLSTEWGDARPNIESGIKAMLKSNGMSDEQVKWAEESGVLKEPALAITLGKIASQFEDDPQIGHHQTRTVSGLHDQLADVNESIKPFIVKGDKIPAHLSQKRLDLMNKLGENL